MAPDGAPDPTPSLDLTMYFSFLASCSDALFFISRTDKVIFILSCIFDDLTGNTGGEATALTSCHLRGDSSFTVSSSSSHFTRRGGPSLDVCKITLPFNRIVLGMSAFFTRDGGFAVNLYCMGMFSH